METSPPKRHQKVPAKNHEKISGSKENQKLNLKKYICSLNRKSSVSRNFVDICKKKILKKVGVNALFPKPSTFSFKCYPF